MWLIKTINFYGFFPLLLTQNIPPSPPRHRMTIVTIVRISADFVLIIMYGAELGVMYIVHLYFILHKV